MTEKRQSNSDKRPHRVAGPVTFPLENRKNPPTMLER